METNREIKHFNGASSEFESADFGDRRLTERLLLMAESVGAAPSESLPESLGDGAGVEGGYRFLRNPRVNIEKILEPHFEKTSVRARHAKKTICIHDTTEFKFSSERDGLGWLHHSKGKRNGFHGHFSLVVSSNADRRPLGIISVESSIATGEKKGYLSPAKKKKDPTRKTLRWIRCIDAAEKRLGESVETIHVMDREADCFEIFSQLKDRGSAFVVRVSRDRLVSDGKSEENDCLYELVQSNEVRLDREVELGSRKKSPFPSTRRIHPARRSRKATLSITATPVILKRTHHNDRALNAIIPVNAIHVFEANPPEGEEGVDWKLFSTEPIGTPEEIESIVDIYRSRWIIEEYFKALKTGCSFEERQLESKSTILNALGLFIPVAWQLLLLRTEARKRPDSKAEVVVTKTQIEVLSAIRKGLPANPTVGQVTAAIAALGGHLRQNGPPGWRVLGRGFKKLLTLEEGWIARQRCDQS